MKSLITSKNLAGALLLLLMNPILWGQSNTSEIFETKSLFKEWISTEKIESKESSDWDIEKESLSDLTELLVEELALHFPVHPTQQVKLLPLPHQLYLQDIHLHKVSHVL